MTACSEANALNWADGMGSLLNANIYSIVSNDEGKWHDVGASANKVVCQEVIPCPGEGEGITTTTSTTSTTTTTTECDYYCLLDKATEETTSTTTTTTTTTTIFIPTLLENMFDYSYMRLSIYNTSFVKLQYDKELDDKVEMRMNPLGTDFAYADHRGANQYTNLFHQQHIVFNNHGMRKSYPEYGAFLSKEAFEDRIPDPVIFNAMLMDDDVYRRYQTIRDMEEDFPTMGIKDTWMHDARLGVGTSDLHYKHLEAETKSSSTYKEFEYALGYPSMGCPAGYEIPRTPEECKRAAQELFWGYSMGINVPLTQDQRDAGVRPAVFAINSKAGSERDPRCLKRPSRTVQCYIFPNNRQLIKIA